MSDEINVYAVAEAIDNLAGSMRRGLSDLGNGDSNIQMGAIEAHGQCVVRAAEIIADAINRLADSVDRI